MEESLLKILFQQGPFAALFVWLLLSTKKEAREREQKLMEHIDKMAVQFEKNTAALQQIERSLSGLEDEMKDMRERLRGA
ncbi:BhlA/UviB family holin-like peptide [Aneurinibacillus thermoaerophilus]|jgi:chromosome segregation ATPase|uniref:BhlA/UviB family holin-like peptide n=1 Tax=Aneurinibacillus thermoaerophilus TaxID=143495 RepID=UPI002E209B5B|nr:BhlA/UviB family holin-like peptide [Aneurinibacillus thermoaerophilus]MED0758544.1 BhlA/UviB family holin-like peptide [Aneurinibacillus thermoaerophilus]MED0761923.1 BhlA/UviB family holin-like peptide [Aneurinibacillus thermoaerophilus]MED0762768.1 BhlA/UviB family holin-like peptide [Aneurinibacillus thermoaerophilus]